MNIKENWNYYSSTTKTVTKNVAQFCDAAALAGVSGYAIYESLQTNHRSFWYKILLVGAVLIALQAFVLLVKHFNRVEAPVAKKK